MAGSPPLLYWDSCVFLSYIDGDPARMPHIRPLLSSAQRRDVEIVTSAIAVTEVAFAAVEKANGLLDETAEQRIDALWRPASGIRLVEFYPEVARRSRSLIRESISRGFGRLSPPDAIHLATAEAMKVARLNTYNLKHFEHWGPLLGFVVEPPTALQPEIENFPA